MTLSTYLLTQNGFESGFSYINLLSYITKQVIEFNTVGLMDILTAVKNCITVSAKSPKTKIKFSKDLPKRFS